MRVVTLTHDYPFPASKVWEIATSYSALATVTAGRLRFRDLPQGRTFTGQHMVVQVSLFGLLPWQPYEMTVLSCDDTQRVLRSSERGAGVERWDHTVHVEETATGCRLRDHIEIEAGALTPLFALWARYMYGARHKPRLRLLNGTT